MGIEEHSSALLSADEGPVAEVINPRGASPIVLVCEHASPFIPESLGDLGLRAADRLSHAAWDIGALDTAKAMSAALDAPLVVSRVSRLVYDCNRPPEAPDAIPAQSERISAPGNAALSETDKAIRIKEIYRPFEALLAETIDTRGASVEALVTIHSFTPVYYGVAREVELGLLHDRDPQLAMAMADLAPGQTELLLRLNEPYAAKDGVTHTLKLHGTDRGLPNVMIEIRNDLVADAAAADRIGTALGGLVDSGLASCLSERPKTAAGRTA